MSGATIIDEYRNGVHTSRVLSEVFAERGKQDARWGQQDYPNGTGPDVQWETPGKRFSAANAVVDARDAADNFAALGELTWADIANEEFWEVLAEDHVPDLRAELIQLAAVCCAWVEAIDRNEANEGQVAA